VTFDSSKVKRLRINGNMATGVFYDLSKVSAKNKLPQDTAVVDTNKIHPRIKKRPDRQRQTIESSDNSKRSGTLAPFNPLRPKLTSPQEKK